MLWPRKVAAKVAWREFQTFAMRCAVWFGVGVSLTGFTYFTATPSNRYCNYKSETISHRESRVSPRAEEDKKWEKIKAGKDLEDSGRLFSRPCR